MHFTKDRCCTSKDDGKVFDTIDSGGVLFVAARPAKPTSREASTLELNPMTAAEVEQAALAREHAGFGVPGPGGGVKLDGDGDPTLATPSAEERALHETSGQLFSTVHCSASGTKLHLSNPKQIKPCQE